MFPSRRLLPFVRISVLGCALACTHGSPRPTAAVSRVAERPPCTDAYAAVCGERGEADRDRARRAKDAIASVERATLDRLGVPTREAWASQVGAQSPDRREELNRLFRKTAATEIAARIAPLRAAAEAEHDRVRRVALAVIASAPLAPRGARDRLERSRLSWPELDRAEAPRPLRRGCGEHLMLDEAWIDKQATDVVLCPGLLLVSSRPGEPEDAFRERLSFMLAHELGHVIAGPTPATPASESEADRWAAEILAADLATRAHTDPSFLPRTLEPICYLDPDPLHGSGRHRIGAVFARSPTLTSTLGCRLPDDA
jgi:hypothetical protein